MAKTLADVTINGIRIPHLVKYENDHSEGTEKTVTFDEVLVDETDEDIKFSISGVRVDRPEILTEAQVFNLTSNTDHPDGHQIIVIDGNTKHTYNRAKRTSFKNARDGKNRPTRDLEFEAPEIKVEDI